jgi:hypothetical protein
VKFRAEHSIRIFLTVLGRQGWELVSILGNGRAYLKRKIAPAQPAKRRVTAVDPD